MNPEKNNSKSSLDNPTSENNSLPSDEKNETGISHVQSATEEDAKPIKSDDNTEDNILPTAAESNTENAVLTAKTEGDTESDSSDVENEHRSLVQTQEM